MLYSTEVITQTIFAAIKKAYFRIEKEDELIEVRLNFKWNRKLYVINQNLLQFCNMKDKYM